MIEFELKNEQKLIQYAVREFSQKEIAPFVREIDDGGKIPEKIIKGLAELGVLGMTVDQEYGGMKADPVLCGIVAEELARADISCAVPTFFLVQNAWGYIFNKYGSHKLKSEVLPKITKGTAFLGIAATEPDAGSDLANIKTIAQKQGDYYIISGEKMFISGVEEVANQLPEGGGHVTLVKTNPEKGTRGMSLFYVPIKHTKGISITLLKDWGRRGISTGGFSMEQVELPVTNLIGEENKGFYIAMEGFDYARAIIAIVASNAALSSLEKGMDYIKKRKAFGQYLGRFEGIQFKLAENWARLESARLFGYKALWMYGKEQEQGTINRFEVTKNCAAAKMFAVPAAFESINDAIQWFGAYGYTVDCPLDLALKGVRSYYWAEGGLEIMKIIVARELLGKDFVAYR